jgi:hypothetical protein
VKRVSEENERSEGREWRSGEALKSWGGTSFSKLLFRLAVGSIIILL